MGRRAHVVPKARQGQLLRSQPSTRVVSGLQNEYAHPRLGEPYGGDQPVRSRPDNDDVHLGHATSVSLRLGAGQTVPTLEVIEMTAMSATGPDDTVGEPVGDPPLEPPSAPAGGGAGGEIVALLLMGIGGLALPLLAPAVGVMLMPSTSRWTPRQVRTTWLILAIGGLALAAGLVLLALADPTSPASVRAGLLLLGVVIVVGPASALYAATRPRPGS